MVPSGNMIPPDVIDCLQSNVHGSNILILCFGEDINPKDLLKWAKAVLRLGDKMEKVEKDNAAIYVIRRKK